MKGSFETSSKSEKMRETEEKQDFSIEMPSNDDKMPESGTTKPSDGKDIDIRYDENEKQDEDETQLIQPTKKENLNDKWTTGIRGALLGLAYFLTCATILIFCMNFVHRRMPQGVPQLPDLGHELIPKLEPEALGDYPMFCLIGGFIVTLVFHPARLRIMIKFFMTIGHLYLLRVVSISVTSLPPTDNHCRSEYVEIPDIYANTIKGLLSLGGSNIHCGDLMFSGHTCMVTTIWMIFMHNFKRGHIVKFAATICLLLTVILIIATRSHYTGDIWIAFWLSFFMYKLTSSTFPFTKKKIRRFFKTCF